MTNSDAERESVCFLESSVLALAWLDARAATPRRLGAAADARWRAFAGTSAALTEPDRLALLLRDAAVLHPGAFSARAVFALPGLCADEPFGAWAGELAPGATAKRLKAPPAAPTDAVALFDAVAARWALSVTERAQDAALGPTTRVALAGASALRAATARFAREGGLDAGAQWLVVTERPALRQLAGVAAMALGSKRAARVVTVSEARGAKSALVAAGVERVDRVWISEDATKDEAAAALALAATMGAAVEDWRAPS